jgi:nucleotide-binding universal stress UspA family protein
MFDAQMVGVGSEVLPLSVFADPTVQTVAELVGVLTEAIERRLADARRLFEEKTSGIASRADWRTCLEAPGDALARLARGADMIVAGHVGAKSVDPDVDVDVGRLIVAAGRPVLVTPRSAPPLSASRVVVAWKDTREARRALTDAMPFLIRADAVTVLGLCEPDTEADREAAVADVATAIRRHGAVGAVTTKVRSDVAATGQEVVLQATRDGADLVVAGGYGHTRLGEWVFGGMTRELLHQDLVHVLMSH